MALGANIKADPTPFIRAHWRTYVDAQTGTAHWPDFLLFMGVPLAVFGLCLAFDVELGGATTAALLTVSGLLGAFLFGVTIQIYERAQELADSHPPAGEAISARATNMEELAANAAYASLTCILAAVAYVIVATTSGWTLRIFSALALGMGSHLILVLLMVMRRLFLRTQASLDEARTGASRGARRRAA